MGKEHRAIVLTTTRRRGGQTLRRAKLVTLQRAKKVRRSKFEIWAELLEACARTTRTQSWLLRWVGLKTQAIKEALTFLVTAGLIKPLATSEDRREYRTTAKGEEALTQYYQLVTKYFAHD